MAAHRYWGLQMLARPGSGNGLSLAEVEMRGSPGGADLCVGGTASGESNFGYVADNVFDNSNSTVWYNGATGGAYVRLSYDFGSPVNVAEIWVRNSPATPYAGATYGPSHTRVQWSDDGTVWRIGTPSFVLDDLGNDDEFTLTGVSDTPAAGESLAAPESLALYSLSWPVVFNAIPEDARLNPPQLFGTRGLSGVVDYITTPAAGRIVRAYDKRSGILLRETTTAGDGTYSFPDLLGDRDYYVVALDTPPNPASAWDTDISPIVQAT
jgi:hypothetical protein